MADDEFPYQYRYHGGSPKVFTTRSKSGEQLLNPGEVLDSDAPMHHGELEPLSQPAKDFAVENELRLERDGGELWADKQPPAKPSKARPAQNDAPKEA